MFKKLNLSSYYLLFSHFPSSYFPLGGLFNRLRIITLKSVIPIGLNTKIQSNVYIGNGNNIEIGSNCQINENVKLDNVKIGNSVMIAPGVTILGKMHRSDRTDIPMMEQGELPVGPTILEDDVWIATNAILMPGLKIGKGTIIGAGAVVTKDCDAYSVYAGVPAKKIKSRV